MASATDQRQEPIANGHLDDAGIKEHANGDVAKPSESGKARREEQPPGTDATRAIDDNVDGPSDGAGSLANAGEGQDSNGSENGVARPEPSQCEPSDVNGGTEAAVQDGQGEPSSQVTSPSISSPPYWMHAHHLGPIGHISNMSVESVLHPGAITLQDNEREDGGSDANNAYGRDRNRACWAKSVQITDHVVVNGSTTNIGAFVVWNIRVRTLSGSNINIRKRYSEFDEFRKQLVQTFPNFEAAVPELPPKSMISKFRPNFLEKRRAGLQYFLNCILLNPEFSGSPVLKEFLFS